MSKIEGYGYILILTLMPIVFVTFGTFPSTLNTSNVVIPSNNKQNMQNLAKIDSSTLFNDNFTKDSNFKSQLWTTDTSNMFIGFNNSISRMCNNNPNCINFMSINTVPLNLGVSSTQGLNITQIKTPALLQAGMIETKNSFTGSFRVTTEIMTNHSDSNSFIFGLVSDDGSQGAVVLGNFNATKEKTYGINLGSINLPTWATLNTPNLVNDWTGGLRDSNVVSSPQNNIWYTITIDVNNCGFAVTTISNEGKVVGSMGIEIGSGSYHVVLGQYNPGYFYANVPQTQLYVNGFSSMSHTYVKYVSVSSDLATISYSSSCVSISQSAFNGNSIYTSIFDTNNSYLYTFSNQQIYVINPVTNSIIKTIKSSNVFLNGIPTLSPVFDSVHNRIYVPCYNVSYNNLFLEIIDANTNSISNLILLTIPSSINQYLTGESLIFDANNSNIYWPIPAYGIVIINTDTNTITIIHLSYLFLFTQFAFDYTKGLLYLPSYTGNSITTTKNFTNQITIFNTNTNSVDKNITIAQYNLTNQVIPSYVYSQGTFYNPENQNIYISETSNTNPYNSFILIYNPNNDKIIKNSSIYGNINKMIFDQKSKSIIMTNWISSELLFFNVESSINYVNVSFLNVRLPAIGLAPLTVDSQNSNSTDFYLISENNLLLKFQFNNSSINQISKNKSSSFPFNVFYSDLIYIIGVSGIILISIITVVEFQKYSKTKKLVDKELSGKSYSSFYEYLKSKFRRQKEKSTVSNQISDEIFEILDEIEKENTSK